VIWTLTISNPGGLTAVFFKWHHLAEWFSFYLFHFLGDHQGFLEEGVN
jgi:hypothetical protein